MGKKSGGSKATAGGASGFEPFADDSAAVTVGGVTVENGRTQVSLSGSLDIGRDKAGLEKARALKAAVDAIVTALEAAGELPVEATEATKPAATVRNPFA